MPSELLRNKVFSSIRINKRILTLILFCLLIRFFSYAQKSEDTCQILCINRASFERKPFFAEIFRNEYPRATQLFESHISFFDSICDFYKIEPEIAIPVVFPEFIRYSMFRDVLETKSLEVIYINLGKEFIDFSIGLMQMKPSFAEGIEEEIEMNSELREKYISVISYNQQNIKNKREERVERLRSEQWQLIYLCAFCDILSIRFKHISFSSTERKIEFYAAAYNSDFKASYSKLKQQIDKRLFPGGINAAPPQYSYSLVAVDFYRNYYALRNNVK